MTPFSEPRRILVTRTDRIGDVVLSTPVLKALRERFPDAFLAVMVRAATREIVEGNPYVNEVIVYDKDGKEKTPWGTYFFARKLKEKNFDAVVNLHPTNRVHWLSYLAAIPVRIGYDKKCGFFLTHTIEDLKKQGLRHESRYNFDLLKFFGMSCPEKIELYFPVSEKNEKDFSAFALKKHLDPVRDAYLVLNPSASCPSKKWAASQFARSADELSRRYGWKTVLIGGKEDNDRSAQVRSAMRTPVLDFTGQLSLAMLGACLKSAKLLVSNDSGPVHVASAVGTPVISIFGRKQPGLSPERWGPLGEKSLYVHKDVGCYVCLAHNCKIDFLCLKVIEAEDVLAAASRLENYFSVPQEKVQTS